MTDKELASGLLKNLTVVDCNTEASAQMNCYKSDIKIDRYYYEILLKGKRFSWSWENHQLTEGGMEGLKYKFIDNLFRGMIKHWKGALHTYDEIAHVILEERIEKYEKDK